MRFDKIDQKKRVFKNGKELFEVRYKAPKRKNQDKLQANIMKFVKNKSDKMSNNENFKDKKINIAIEYENGDWISSAFATAGDNLELGMDYSAQEIGKQGKIKSFTINFF